MMAKRQNKGKQAQQRRKNEGCTEAKQRQRAIRGIRYTMMAKRHNDCKETQ